MSSSIFMANMKFVSFIFLSLLYLVAHTECYGARVRKPRSALLKAQMNSLKKQAIDHYFSENVDQVSKNKSTPRRTVYVASQKGRKEADKIDRLPGQPNDVKFSQYSGYVTVDPNAGRALFYYFVEAEYSSTKPLVLWLNGGPGCSSIGGGALIEVGPFRVNPDGKSLRYNKYAWNNVSNVLFVESPAGVGFSYSNTSSDYITGDNKTAWDSYTFLVNWLDRFPEYKTRDFFITGESYAGHYVPQLADLILQQNKNSPHTIIKLKGIAMGNAYIDFTDMWSGTFNYYWTHALISDEAHQEILKSCDFSSSNSISKDCDSAADKAYAERGDIYLYDIYAPQCGSSSNASSSISSFDTCSENYTSAYLNIPEVQKALHANITGRLPGQWQDCNDPLEDNWTDMLDTLLPVIKNLMTSGISIWFYTGDTDSVVSVTSTMYSMDKLEAQVQTRWYTWYSQGDVGGHAVGYEKNLTFVSVRGAGHMVPAHQPGRALTLFTSFLQGQLPPRK